MNCLFACWIILDWRDTGLQASKFKKFKTDHSKSFADVYEAMKESINLNAEKQVNITVISINDLPDEPSLLLDRAYEALVLF